MKPIYPRYECRYELKSFFTCMERMDEFFVSLLQELHGPSIRTFMRLPSKLFRCAS